MFRPRFVVPLLVVVGLLSSGFLMGEGKKKEKEASAVRVRLPRNYGKVGLSGKQKGEIYAILRKYAPEIRKLTEQINELKARQKTEVENVLSAEQKEQLKELNSKGRKGRAKKGKKKAAEKK